MQRFARSSPVRTCRTSCCKLASQDRLLLRGTRLEGRGCCVRRDGVQPWRTSCCRHALGGGRCRRTRRVGMQRFVQRFRSSTCELGSEVCHLSGTSKENLQQLGQRVSHSPSPSGQGQKASYLLVVLVLDVVLVVKFDVTGNSTNTCNLLSFKPQLSFPSNLIVHRIKSSNMHR